MLIFELVLLSNLLVVGHRPAASPSLGISGASQVGFNSASAGRAAAAAAASPAQNVITGQASYPLPECYTTDSGKLFIKVV